MTFFVKKKQCLSAQAVILDILLNNMEEENKLFLYFLIHEKIFFYSHQYILVYYYSLISTASRTVGSLQDMLSNRGNTPRCLQPTNSITNLRVLPVWPMKEKTVGG